MFLVLGKKVQEKWWVKPERPAIAIVLTHQRSPVEGRKDSRERAFFQL